MKKPCSHQDSLIVGAHGLQDFAGSLSGLPGESDSGQSYHEQQKIGKKRETKKKEREKAHSKLCRPPWTAHTGHKCEAWAFRRE